MILQLGLSAKFIFLLEVWAVAGLAGLSAIAFFLSKISDTLERKEYREANEIEFGR